MTYFHSEEIGWQNCGIFDSLLDSRESWSSFVAFSAIAAFVQSRWLEVVIAQ